MGFTGRDPPLFNGKGIRGSLRVALKDGFTRGEVLIKFVRELHRTLGNALSAGSTLGEINVAGTLYDVHLEMTRLPFKRLNISIGDDLDIEVSPYLHQFGRDDTHGAVIGGEGFV
jgi:hypothetical protein